MEPRRRVQGPGSGGTTETAPPRQVGAGADAYPFDAGVRIEEQRDLDLLRCIKDRTLAAYLYELYALADRNSTAQPTPQRAAPLSVFAIRALADRALAGEFGCDARELAEYLLLDETGRPRTDARSLRAFAQAFAKLRRE
jgi:hypothetical protein